LTSNGVLTFKPTSSLRNGYGGGYLEKTLREMYSDVEEFKELDSDLLCRINAIVTSERSE
jgi:CRISPR/Cas system CSM-associated protein Csm5 (group 7 of RAMP superfamily)